MIGGGATHETSTTRSPLLIERKLSVGRQGEKATVRQPKGWRTALLPNSRLRDLLLRQRLE
ncbi:MAG: hypothetical protein BMS9Abin29_0388 [Gemmatimonadota bacterium]|nr:MAG: hypothetical protein BMS9Abin29_0388 [Gemmatimonadota bacterium]